MIYELSTKKSGTIRTLAAVFLVLVFFIIPMVPAFAATTQTQPPTVTNYTYDPSGQRITVSKGATTTVYPTKNYNTNGTNVTKHVFAGSQDIATIEGSGADAKVYYNHTDTLNSSSVVTDSTGAIAETMDYYPFGSIRIDNKTGTFNEQRKYIGQEYDTGTGLNYLNARYYNSSLARFISQDPMSWNFDKSWLSDPQNQNSYAYARNNPIIGSDPSGERAEVGIKSISVFSIKVPLLGMIDIKIPGAHGDINISAEPGANLSQYGEGPRYTIGGYQSNNIPWSNKLQVQINNPDALNYPESKYIASYPLSPPTGVSVAQYDQKLLESASKLANSDLGEYFGAGRPISSKANSGNAWTQVVIDSGGVVPQIQKVYYGPSWHGLSYPYIPAGSGSPLETPSYAQQTVSAVKNTINSVKSAFTSSISSTFNTIKSKLHK